MLCLFISGCASTSLTFSEWQYEKVMSGTKANLNEINSNVPCSTMGCMAHMFDKPVAYLDLFPSFVFDILFLPYTVPHDIFFVQMDLDCYQPTKKVYREICSDHELRALHRKMEEEYAKAYNALSIDQQAELLATQRRWIKDRNNNCGNAPQIVECLTNEYLRRIQSLQ